MKNILNRQLIFIPFLYVLSKLLWGMIPIHNLNETIKMALHDLFGPAAIMVTMFLSCIYLLWKFPGLDILIQFLYGTKPNFQGTWKGKLSYEYAGEKKEKNVYLVIKQPDGYFINIWLLTDERISSSVFADIVPYKGGKRIYYSYETEDSSQNKEKNPLHSGFCYFTVGNNSLKGIYYTSRKTTGELLFEKKSMKIATNYEAAKKIFGDL
jgi:hypothetical protein